MPRIPDAAGPLADALDALTTSAAPELTTRERDDRVRCLACGHRCLIFPGQRGICRVRVNVGGELRVPFGYVAALQCDPIEKKPFYHVRPGHDALTFGMLGCDLSCEGCQNWEISQALRDADAGAQPREMDAARIAELAVRYRARMIASSYNEPLITSEWGAAVMDEGHRRGLVTAFVSNGNATPEVLDHLRPHLDCYKVDLKSMRDATYRRLGTKLENVLATIRGLARRGFWVEIVTLLIPGFNDSDAEIRDAARFLVSVDPLVPWHVTAFHPDYKMADRNATTARQLVRAAEIGCAEGLRYVYCGNLPGGVDPFEDTRCHGCGQTVIRRAGYRIVTDRLTATAGKCPSCATVVPGIWA